MAKKGSLRNSNYIQQLKSRRPDVIILRGDGINLTAIGIPPT